MEQSPAPTPKQIVIPLPNQSPTYFLHTITSLLTPAECKALIALHSPSLTPTSGGYTTRTRSQFDDASLASLLWARLAPFYGTEAIVDADSAAWTPTGLNPHFRFCRYGAGDAFTPHVDGNRLAGVDAQSFLTVNIYLNTVAGRAGGATRVLDRAGGEPYAVVARVQPVAGAASVFRSEALFHDGEVVREGEKYLLRTDVMFEREEAFDLDRACEGLGQVEKARKALEIAERLEDGSNTTDAMVWYRRAYKLDPMLEMS